MNLDEMICKAVKILKTVGIVQTDKNDNEYIDKSFRGQISSFGAAIQIGSLIPAIAFYSNQGGSKTDRQNLMKAIYLLLNPDEVADNVKDSSLLQYVINNKATKKQVIDAAVAIKLAMNAYNLCDSSKRKKDGE